MSTPSPVDILIVGGGPAGLSAALYAGRGRRRIVVVDAGVPRHAVSDGIHNLIGLEGIAPMTFRERAWEQLAPFDVHHREGRVEALDWDGTVWTATLSDGARIQARAALLAMGVVDLLPDWPGLAQTWGTTVHVCPFCHGWELRDRPLAAYGHGDHTAMFARMLTSWSDDVVVITGDAHLPDDDVAALEAAGIPMHRGHPVALEHEGPELTGLHLDDGTLLQRTGLFLGVQQRQVPLVRSLDLATEPDPRIVDGWVKVDDMGRTSLPMMWAAGDVCTRMQQVSRAIASGGLCGAMMHSTLSTR